MMNKKLLIGLILLLIIISFLFYKTDSLPPRTAHKVARLVSELKITNKGEVLYFNEEWSFNGDGELNICIKLTEKDIKRIKTVLNKNVHFLEMDSFEKMVILNGSFLTEEKIDKLIGVKGFFKIEIDKKDPRTFDLSVIDTTNKLLYIFIRDC